MHQSYTYQGDHVSLAADKAVLLQAHDKLDQAMRANNEVTDKADEVSGAIQTASGLSEEARDLIGKVHELVEEAEALARQAIGEDGGEQGAKIREAQDQIVSTLTAAVELYSSLQTAITAVEAGFRNDIEAAQTALAAAFDSVLDLFNAIPG
jgi:DNA repair exonuclease SbcCD ATPase subunit